VQVAELWSGTLVWGVAGRPAPAARQDSFTRRAISANHVVLFPDEEPHNAGPTNLGDEIERLKTLRRAAAARDQQRCIGDLRMSPQHDGGNRGAA
jgi:hypothetical protein